MHLIIVESGRDCALVRCPDNFLDASNASHFKRDLHAVLAEHPRVVLDLRNVEFLDSSGLGALLSCLRKANAFAGDIKLCNVQDVVRAVLTMTRLDRILDVYETVEDARAALRDDLAPGSSNGSAAAAGARRSAGGRPAPP